MPSQPPTATDWANHFSSGWLDHADRLEAQLEPVDQFILAAADLQPGHSALDVGCGRGATTAKAARLVGSVGLATGIDVADALIQAAHARPSDGTGARIRWIVGDAQRHPFVPDSVDVVSHASA